MSGRETTTVLRLPPIGATYTMLDDADIYIERSLNSQDVIRRHSRAQMETAAVSLASILSAQDDGGSQLNAAAGESKKRRGMRPTTGLCKEGKRDMSAAAEQHSTALANLDDLAADDFHSRLMRDEEADIFAARCNGRSSWMSGNMKELQRDGSEPLAEKGRRLLAALAADDENYQFPSTADGMLPHDYDQAKSLVTYQSDDSPPLLVETEE